MGEGGGTFFEELASKRYPPEVRQEINWQAVARADTVLVFGGVAQGEYPTSEDYFPSLGADLHVRIGQEFGTGAGLAPSLVELKPRPNLQQIVKQLQPELQALIAQMK